MIYYLDEGFFDKFKKKEKLEEDSNSDMDDLYEKFKSYIKTPYSLGDGYDSDILIAARVLGYPISKLVSAYKSSPKMKKVGPRGIFGKNVTDDQINKLHCSADDKLIVILENDDYLLLLNPNGNFLETDCKDDVYSYGKSFYEFDNYKGNGFQYDSEDWERFKKNHKSHLNEATVEELKAAMAKRQESEKKFDNSLNNLNKVAEQKKKRFSLFGKKEG